MKLNISYEILYKKKSSDIFTKINGLGWIPKQMDWVDKTNGLGWIPKQMDWVGHQNKWTGWILLWLINREP